LVFLENNFADYLLPRILQKKTKINQNLIKEKLSKRKAIKN